MDRTQQRGGKLRKAIRTESLGKAWKQWENQRKICGGNHAQFAEHLLAVHNSCCANYVNATASIMTMTSTI